jgi:hypothetical protein
MSYNIDYGRLSYLGERLRAGIASKQEKDEYMLLLYQNGNITQQQYNDYLTNQNAEQILKAALAVGAVVLIGYLLKELFSSK